MKSEDAKKMKYNWIMEVVSGQLVLEILGWNKYTLKSSEGGVGLLCTNWLGTDAALLMRS